MMQQLVINHDIIIKNGECVKIRDVYGVNSSCSDGITPTISTNVNTTFFRLTITSSIAPVTSIPSNNITVFVSECPIGSGYESGALLLDCNVCRVNTFKVKAGNEACYECESKPDGFSCDGSYLINIDYNQWFIAYNTKTKDFVSPFTITSNNNLYLVQTEQCPVEF